MVCFEIICLDVASKVFGVDSNINDLPRETDTYVLGPSTANWAHSPLIFLWWRRVFVHNEDDTHHFFILFHSLRLVSIADIMIS